MIGEREEGKPMLSRRGFVVGACASTAALVGGALLDGSVASTAYAQGAEEEAAEVLCGGPHHIDMKNVAPFPALDEPESYDQETDILVIGYGVGGTSAALTAVNRGCKVIALERSTRDHWYEHGGVHFIWIFGDPAWLKREGIASWDEATVKNFVLGSATSLVSDEDMETATSYFLNMPKAFDQIKAAGGNATTFNWVEVLPSFRHMPNMVPVNENIGGTATEREMFPYMNKYHAVENALDRVIQEKGGQVLWGTPATNLVVNADGAVVGAKAVTPEGTEIFIKAKAVIDCVGGYGANFDMVKSMNGNMEEILGFHTGPLVNDGAGIRLCQGAGAALRGAPRAEDYADAGLDAIGLGLQWNLIYETPNPMFIPAFLDASVQLGRQPLLKVNKYGKRFMNEDETWTNKVKYAYKQPGHRFFTICDNTLEDFLHNLYNVQGRWGACERMSIEQAGYYLTDDQIFTVDSDWRPGFKAGVEKGWIVQADSIEELAQKCGINAENFKKTVEEYNAMCEAGEDTQFGNSVLWPVKEPPFYGLERKPGFAWGCGSVLATDKDGHVLNAMGETIPGLYCGANDAALLNYGTGEFFTDGLIAGGSAHAITISYLSANTAANEIAS